MSGWVLDLSFQGYNIPWVVKKIFMLAGEPSGDLHASYLIKELLDRQSDLVIKGWGGNKMSTAGAEILRSLDHLAFMGFAEVARNFSTILTNFRLCKKQISEFDPDVIVFVDYPGFNLRMAKWAKSKGYKTVQYIAPAAWAWKENRVTTIKKYVDELLVILPFEKAFFAKHGIDAHYVGHPLVQEIADWKADPNFELSSSGEKNIGLFPGSRMQEIKLILPIMMELAKTKTNYEFHIAVAPNLDIEIYQSQISGIENVHLVSDKNYDLLSKVDATVVTSGTATLEVAMFDVPQVVVYKTNPISYSIAKRLVKTEFISLVNLICEKEVVSELIQEELNLENLKVSITSIFEKKLRNRIMLDYKKVKISIRQENHSPNTAMVILHNL